MVVQTSKVTKIIELYSWNRRLLWYIKHTSIKLFLKFKVIFSYAMVVQAQLSAPLTTIKHCDFFAYQSPLYLLLFLNDSHLWKQNWTSYFSQY